MHMANELLSVPVATGTLAIAAGGLGLICRKVSRIVSSDKLSLMGILGAFIFAAQMVNFQLPAMPGTSGHMVGAVLLAIILGPHLAAIVISSVIIVQCLIFQDGGLLALGCNIINMALVPSYVGYFLYKGITVGQSSGRRTYIGAMLACVVAVESGAVLVPIEAALSGVLAVPFSTFLITMIGVHFLVGLVEGLVTVAVLSYLQQVRPDLVLDSLPGKIRLSRKTVLVTLLVFAMIAAAGLSLLASKMPDGLEWSYRERPNQPDFKPIIANENTTITAVDQLQSKYTLLPDYTVRGASADTSKGWTSFAGVLGSLLTMLAVWAGMSLMKRKQTKALGSS
ncbi:MAG: energy-coupling factor ABC transporter permease [Sedimentisphaerales bacterium]|jgi:cobalt/nickel transport system permease protein